MRRGRNSKGELLLLTTNKDYIMPELLKKSGLLLLLLCVSSCATIVRGTTQQVSINSDPDGAKVTISNGQSCQTPCNIEVERKTSLQLTLEREHCRRQTTSMIPTLAGAGAVLGGIIDYGTGAVYDLQPNPLFVTMVCDEEKIAKEEKLKKVYTPTAAGE